MSNAQVARAVAHLNWVHGVTAKITQDWPDAQATHQNVPTDNHLIWTLGHLATTNDWFCTLLLGGTLSVPETYSALFGYGSKPKSSAKEYPPIAEVRAHFDRTFAALAGAAAKLTDAQGSQPCLADSHGFAKDQLHVIELAAWHDGWHSGQLASLRKALGLPSVIG